MHPDRFYCLNTPFVWLPLPDACVADGQFAVVSLSKTCPWHPDEHFASEGHFAHLEQISATQFACRCDHCASAEEDLPPAQHRAVPAPPVFRMPEDQLASVPSGMPQMEP